MTQTKTAANIPHLIGPRSAKLNNRRMGPGVSNITTHPEIAMAETLTPMDYLLLRLNAIAQNRSVLPAVEGWRINTRAQKRDA